MAITKRTVQTAATILEGIHRFWIKNKYAPSIRDLEAITGLSHKTVVDRVTDLHNAGLIDKEDGIGNTIRPIGLQVRMPMIPMASLFEKAGLVFEQEQRAWEREL